MKAPDKIFVEVCEEGIFAFPEPPFAESVEYIRADINKQPVEGLEEAAWDCVLDSIDVNNPVLLPKYKELLTYLFKAGAKWQAEKDARDMYMSDNRHFEKIYELGKKDMKAKMLDGAVEGRYMKAAGRVYVESWPLDIVPDLVKSGDEVKIIIVKEDDK